MTSTIFHLDLDSFFVSVERILEPSLKGKPVIVGADPEQGRGVVAACSYEAREYGLHSAMPIKEAYRLCPNGIYLPGHHKEYVRFSRAVKRLLERHTPQIEQASVDEFYMDFTGLQRIYGSMFELAKKLQREVKEQLSLPSSIGIGSNKTIAKIGSDYAKPEGITYVLPGMEKEFLAPLPVETIPGVGKVMKRKLTERGFYFIADVANTPEDYFAAAFGKYGLDLWRKANGEGSRFLNPRGVQKSISKEHTYGKDEIDLSKIETTLFELTAHVCQNLRNLNLQASTVSVKLRYSDFVTVTREQKIKPTDDDKEIYKTALSLLGKAYSRRVSIRLIGVKVSKFTEYAEQFTLFDEKAAARKRLLRTITKIRDKFGFAAIRFGGFK